MNFVSSKNKPAPSDRNCSTNLQPQTKRNNNNNNQQQAETQGNTSIQPTLMINFNENSPIETDCDEQEEEKCVCCNTPDRRVSIPEEQQAQVTEQQSVIFTTTTTTATAISVITATTTTNAFVNDIPTIAPSVRRSSKETVCEIANSPREPAENEWGSGKDDEVSHTGSETAPTILIDLAITSTSSVKELTGGDSPRRKQTETNLKGQSKSNSSNIVGVRDEDTVSKSSDTSGEIVRGSCSLDSSCTDKPNRSSKLSERAKKKSWYNVLYPNYKSRSQDFKKHFEGVPKDERLIVDYSCALQRDILIQGRLYVSQNYVCFHANIFRWETYLTVKWKDVTSITKEKTALVIPNAISICTATEKYFFATFTSRDKAFLMLFRIWQNTLMNKQMLPQEMWQWVHNCYGDELGLTTDDEDYIDPSSIPNESECDLDFATALDDSISNSNSQNLTIADTSEYSAATNSQNNQNKSNSSGGSSCGGATPASSVGKTKNSDSKTKTYFFSAKDNTKSSGSSTTNSTSTSGSDNRASYSNSRAGKSDKSKTQMKTNAKELTLISAKPDEGSGSGNSTIPQTPGSSGPGAGASGGAESVIPSPARDRDSKSFASTYDGKRKAPKNSRLRDDSLVKNSDPLPTDVSDSSDSDENKIPFVATAECNSTHEGRQLVHTILPINIETLFSFLFSKSKFLLDFHAMRKSTELSFGEWITNEEGKRTRTVNVTVQLSASVGPKTAKVTESQEMRECSKPGELYSIDINSVNAGIPYADSFCVLMHYCLVRTVDDHTMLSVHAQIKYKKSIWGVVKGFIEKNTWAGLEDFFSSLLHSLQSETCIPPAKGKGRRPRRGIAAQNRPTDETPSTPKHDSIENAPTSPGTLTGTHTPSTPQASTDGQRRSTQHKWLSVFVILLLGFLIVLNVLLLLKLWKLEERINDDLSQRARLPNLASLKQLPNNHEDWIDLLRQQEILHETELKKWHKVLQTAIELLKKTEKTLGELMFR